MDKIYNIKCGMPLILDHEYAHCANTVEFQGFGKVQEISSVYLLLGRPVQLKIPLTEDSKLLVTAPITKKAGRVKAQLMECKLAENTEDEYEYVRYSNIFEVVITPSLAVESQIEVTDPRLELVYAQIHEAYLAMLAHEQTASASATAAAADAATAYSEARTASTHAREAEGYAVGEQNGQAVIPGSYYYENNAKYYSEQAASSATTATTKASEASASATSAASSASTATTKATEAAASATAAAASASAAQAAVSEVADLANVTAPDLGSTEWEIGTISVGVDADSTTRVRTKGYIELGQIQFLNVTIESGYKFVIAFYRSNGTNIMQTSFQDYSCAVFIPSGATKYRVVVADINNGTADISYGGKVTVTGVIELIENISALNDEVGIISDYAEMPLTFTDQTAWTYNPITMSVATEWSQLTVEFSERDSFKITAKGGTVFNIAFYMYADQTKGKVIDNSGADGTDVEFNPTQRGMLYINTTTNNKGFVAIKKKTARWVVDQMGDLSDKVNALYGVTYPNHIEWEYKKISAWNGTVTDATNRYKTVNPLPIWVKSVSAAAGYSFGLFAYNGGTYVGWWNGTAWSVNDLVWTDYIYFNDAITGDGYDLFVVFRKTDNTALSESDIPNIIFNAPTNATSDYMIDSELQKHYITLDLLGVLTYHQAFCKYNGKYYSTDGEHIAVQDENFNAVTSATLSVGHGNGFCVGSDNKGYISGWSDQKLYVINLDTLELDSVITLPTVGYTTCAVDDVNGLIYIFQRDSYPSTKECYNLIVYDYVNDEIKSTVKTSVPYAAMQACDLYRDRLIALYGTGIDAKPNGYIIYNTKGEILGEYVIGSKSNIEPEGIFFDRNSHELLISYVNKYVYKIFLS